MANNQISGSASTSTSTDNNGSAMIGLGANATNVTNVGLGRPVMSVFGSTVVNGDQTDPAVSGGTFAYNNNRGVIRRVTATVAGGVATNPASFLTSGASHTNGRTSIHKIQSIGTSDIGTRIRAGDWNIYSGEFTTALTAGTLNFHAIDGGANVDNAANVSRSAPGELTYRDGSALPVNDDYPEKTG